MSPEQFDIRPDGAAGRRTNERFNVPPIWNNARYTPLKVQNLVQARLEHNRGDVVLASLPMKLTIESTTICNLRCPACFTGAERKGRHSGHMTVELFEWLMRELGPTLFEVELHNWGEPLLGRHVYDFIEMAMRAGVSTTISTNFSVPFDDEKAERLVSSGLNTLGCSIDGATQSVYEQYRRRGKLELVLENARKVAAAKRRLGSPTPALIWAYHVFPFNAHEVEAAKKIAEDIGMVFAATRAWMVGDENNDVSEFPYPFAGGSPQRCFFLWYQAVVHHDGGIAPCCGTFYAEDDFDRLDLDPEALSKTSFRQLWNGPHFVEARRLFRNRQAGPKSKKLACFDCAATTDFEGWMQALRMGETKGFKKASSNEGFNYFWERKPEDGLGLVKLIRKPGTV